MTTKMVTLLAQLIEAYSRCRGLVSDRKEESNHWREMSLRHLDSIGNLMKTAPSGSGIDNGTVLSIDRSSRNKLVFETAYHHMNEHGMYTGWTHHTVTVKADLMFGVKLHISGRNRNDVKAYLHECFEMWLLSEVSK